MTSSSIMASDLLTSFILSKS